MYSCIGFIKICCCMQELKTVIINLLILHFNVLISLKFASICTIHDLSTCCFCISTCLFHLNCHWMMKNWSAMIFNLLFFIIQYVDFIKTESEKMKFNFTIFNRLIFKISQLISLNQILFLISDALILL